MKRKLKNEAFNKTIRTCDRIMSITQMLIMIAIVLIAITLADLLVKCGV